MSASSAPAPPLSVTHISAPTPPPLAKQAARRGAVTRDFEEDYVEYTNALPHQQAKWWFGTITNLEGRPPVPENAQLYVDWRVPEDALYPGTGRIFACQYQAERGLPSERRFAGLLHIQIVLGIHMGKVRYNQLNQMLGLQDFQVHWKTCRSPPHAWDYCAKEESRIPGASAQTWGEPPEPRWAAKQRTETAKIDRIKEIIEKKGSERDVYESEDRAFAYRNPRAVQKMKSLYQAPDFEFRPKLIYILWGPTGSAKTYTVRKFVRENKLRTFIPMSGPLGEWWDEYDNEECLLVEEVRSVFDISCLLQLFDGYEFRARVKGTLTALRIRIILLTAEKNLSDWKCMHCSNTKRQGEPALLSEAEVSQIRRRIYDPPEPRAGDPPNKWQHLRMGAVIEMRKRTPQEVATGLAPYVIPNLSGEERAFYGLPKLGDAEMDVIRPDLRQARLQREARDAVERLRAESFDIPSPPPEAQRADEFFRHAGRLALEEEHAIRLRSILPEAEPEEEDSVELFKDYAKRKRLRANPFVLTEAEQTLSSPVLPPHGSAC